ncbi:uncharacterized protein JCM10292_001708 [Rhodotorula paludigena]|uniref:uncharacterized protein n=1 Tax=Rhodotorula paludigena TaxID=86838 RepID=UPI00317784D2
MKPLSPVALQTVASLVLPPAQAQLQGSEQITKSASSFPRLAYASRRLMPTRERGDVSPSTSCPVELTKQKGLGDVKLGLLLDLKDPTMFQFAHKLALRCWEELLLPICKSFRVIYGRQAAGADSGTGRMKLHNACKKKKGTSGNRVPLAHIAIHGDANFVAQVVHNEGFSTGKSNAIATADSELPKSCSLALVATGLFNFDKVHAVVNLIEDATITSCKGWQRPNCEVAQEHVGRVKKLFSPEGLLSNQVTQEGMYGLLNVLGWLRRSKISLTPTFVNSLGVTPRRLGVSIQRNDHNGQLKEFLWAVDLQGKRVDVPSIAVNNHFYHTNKHLSKIITLLVEYRLKGCLPGDLGITDQEIQQAKETVRFLI